MKNNALAAAFMNKFRPVNPDVLPEGRHIVRVADMGIKEQDHLTAEDLKRIREENGFDDFSFTVAAYMENDNGRIMRNFHIAGYHKFKEAMSNKAHWVREIGAKRLKLTKAQFDQAMKDPKFVNDTFLKYFREGRGGYLVMSMEDGSWMRPYHQGRLDSSLNFLNKFAGACKMTKPEVSSLEELLEAIFEGCIGKILQIEVKDSTDHGLEVTQFFTAS